MLDKEDANVEQLGELPTHKYNKVKPTSESETEHSEQNGKVINQRAAVGVDAGENKRNQGESPQLVVMPTNMGKHELARHITEHKTVADD